MLKMFRIWSLVAVTVMVLGNASARAGLVTLNSVGDSATFSYDGTNSSPSCAACLAEITLTVVSTTSLKFELENTSTDAVSNLNLLTAFGFNFTPDIDFTGATAVFNDLDWKLATAGMGKLEFKAGTINGVNDALDAGERGSIVVTLGPKYYPVGSTTAVTPFIGVPLEVDRTIVHFQALVGGNSIKPVGELCIDCNDVHVPDGGMTVSLMGLALAGMGVLRRRIR